MFYCAHAIFYFKLLDGEQETFLVHENVYFIEGEDREKATELAVQVASSHEDLNEDGHLELNERQAAYLFAGIRKLVEVETSPVPVSVSGLIGLELSYSVLEVDTPDQVYALARGEMVELLYRE
jgi:hypothetical protein